MFKEFLSYEELFTTINKRKILQIIDAYDGFYGSNAFTKEMFQKAYHKATYQLKEELLLSIVRPGDTIVFDSVSRMSRDAESGYKLYMHLYEKGINTVFIAEPHISSEYFRRASEQSIGTVGNDIADVYIRATNEVLMLLARQQIKLAFEQADKEAADTRERIKQGLREREAKTGLKNGRKKGDKVIVHKKADRIRLIKKHSKDFYGTNTDVEIMQLLEPISNNTYYAYKAEARKQFEAEQKAGINPFRFKLKTA